MKPQIVKLINGTGGENNQEMLDSLKAMAAELNPDYYLSSYLSKQSHYSNVLIEG